MFFSIHMSLKTVIWDGKLLSDCRQLEVAVRIQNVFAKLSTCVQPYPRIPPGSGYLLLLLFKASSPWGPLGSGPLPPSDALSVISFLFCICNLSFSTHSFLLPKKHFQNSHILKKKNPSLSLRGSLALCPSLTSPQTVCFWKKSPNPQFLLPPFPPIVWLGQSRFCPLPTETLLARVASSYFISKVYGRSIGQTALDALDHVDYSSSLTLFLPLLCMTLLVSGFPASLIAVPYWFLVGSSFFLCPPNVGVVPYCFVSGDFIYSHSFRIGCADSFPVYIPGLPLSWAPDLGLQLLIRHLYLSLINMVKCIEAKLASSIFPILMNGTSIFLGGAKPLEALPCPSSSLALLSTPLHQMNHLADYFSPVHFSPSPAALPQFRPPASFAWTAYTASWLLSLPSGSPFRVNLSYSTRVIFLKHKSDPSTPSCP